MDKRNYVLDLLRFVFALIIIIHHSYFMIGKYIYAPSGYLGVEFFFMVSGIFMMRDIENINGCIQDIGVKTRKFIAKKVIKIAPYFFMSILVSYLIRFFLGNEKNLIHNILYGILEMLMLQMAGFPSYCATGVAWYLSALFLACILIFPLALKYKTTYVNIIAPFSSTMLIGWLYQKYSSIGSDPGLWCGNFHKGFVRALAEISLGTLIFYFSQYISDHLSEKRMTKIFLGIIELICYLIVIAIIFLFQSGDKDLFAILFLFIGLAITVSKKLIIYQLMNFKIFGVLGKYSITMFLNNVYWAMVFKNISFGLSNLQMLIIYMSVSFVTSLIIYYFVEMMKKSTLYVIS